MIGGWAGIAGGAYLIWGAWTHNVGTGAIWIAAATAAVAWFVAPIVLPGTSGALAAFAEPLVLVAAVVSAVTGQWLLFLALLVVGLACDLGRRRAAAIKDDLARAGIEDPAWPASN